MSNTFQNIEWKTYEKIAFRFFFILFFIFTVPLKPDFYTNWFTTDWSHLHIRDMGFLSGISKEEVKVNSLRYEFGWDSYRPWLKLIYIALGGTVLWTIFDRKSKNYATLYYFIKVAVAYAMLIKMNGLTFTKIFPTQMPPLALTQLNTNLGDFTAQKLYWIQLSFVPWYQTFLGFGELALMFLLFFRSTRAIGAALSIALVGNITMANLAYDGGVHLAATFFTIGGIFLLWSYLPSIWQLIVNQKDTLPNQHYFGFKKPWQKWLRIGLKTFVFLFYFVLSGFLHYKNFKEDPYKVPATAGLPNARGLYDVSEFKINGSSCPENLLDSLRWQKVTFEKWSTLSFSVANTFNIHQEAGRGKEPNDIDRTYESAGTGGGRRHYYYTIDKPKGMVFLKSKNKNYANETMELHYQQPDSNTVILSGKNQYQQDIYVKLIRNNKKYPLLEELAN